MTVFHLQCCYLFLPFSVLAKRRSGSRFSEQFMDGNFLGIGVDDLVQKFDSRSKSEGRTQQLLFLSSGSLADSSVSAPRLSSSLPHTITIKGEEISLKCSLPEETWAEKFFFHCKDQSDLTIKHKFLNRNTVILRTADLNSNQIKIICTCRYWETSNRWSFSPNSNHLVFSIVGKMDIHCSEIFTPMGVKCSTYENTR